MVEGALVEQAGIGFDFYADVSVGRVHGKADALQGIGPVAAPVAQQVPAFGHHLAVGAHAEHQGTAGQGQDGVAGARGGAQVEGRIAVEQGALCPKVRVRGEPPVFQGAAGVCLVIGEG